MITSLKEGDLIYSHLTEYVGIVFDVAEGHYRIFWPQSKLGYGIADYDKSQNAFYSQHWTILVHSNL